MASTLHSLFLFSPHKYIIIAILQIQKLNLGMLGSMRLAWKVCEEDILGKRKYVEGRILT